jgi:hypothetical protein
MLVHFDYINWYYSAKVGEDFPGHSDARFDDLVHPKYLILSQEVGRIPDDPFKHWPTINVESSSLAICHISTLRFSQTLDSRLTVSNACYV